jgi:hypothetical protein
MRAIDPGHVYELDCLDGGNPQTVIFVKREGAGYPFNIGHHAGTNCQEVLRALIDRAKYLQRQIPCPETELALDHLRSALRLFEERAALRHGRELPNIPVEIESVPTCKTCGHIGCAGHVA